MSRSSSSALQGAADFPSVSPTAPVGTPGRGRPRKTAEGSARRTELIQIAARSFRLKGYDATTTRDIASESGMQSGSPFYHFKTKNELLFAVMQEGMDSALRSQELALSRLPAQTNAQQTLYALVMHHLHVLLDPGNDFIAVMVTEQRGLLPEQRRAIKHVRDRYEQIWRDVLDTLDQQGALHAPASITRLALFGALHGSLNWYDNQQRLDLPELATHYIAIFVRQPSDCERTSDCASDPQRRSTPKPTTP